MREKFCECWQVRPDADIVVPMYAPYTRADLVSPFAGPRNITALLRFEVVPGDGKYLIANHGQPCNAPLFYFILFTEHDAALPMRG